MISIFSDYESSKRYFTISRNSSLGCHNRYSIETTIAWVPLNNKRHKSRPKSSKPDSSIRSRRTYDLFISLHLCKEYARSGATNTDNTRNSYEQSPLENLLCISNPIIGVQGPNKFFRDISIASLKNM